MILVEGGKEGWQGGVKEGNGKGHEGRYRWEGSTNVRIEMNNLLCVRPSWHHSLILWRLSPPQYDHTHKPPRRPPACCPLIPSSRTGYGRVKRRFTNLENIKYDKDKTYRVVYCSVSRSNLQPDLTCKKLSCRRKVLLLFPLELAPDLWPHRWASAGGWPQFTRVTFNLSTTVSSLDFFKF